MPPKIAKKATGAKKPASTKGAKEPVKKATSKSPTPSPVPMAAAAPTLTPSTSATVPSRVIGGLPSELVTNRVLTHYDETAGVAIARYDVDQNKAMGHIVVPLTDAYKTRYEKLRAILTGRLLPKREHLLQLRRKLQKASEDVHAKKDSIERETRTDTDQILRRLDTAESFRQGAILHQVNKIDEELVSIERLVKRVEQANLDETEGLSSTGVLITSANPGSIPVETIRAPRAVGMCELIQEYGNISQDINDKATRQITIQVDFPTDDFRRETAERLEVIARCDNYMSALSVKDHMLWKALQDKERADEALRTEKQLLQEYADEMANWAETSQQLIEENMRLKAEKALAEERNREYERILRERGIVVDFNRM